MESIIFSVKMLLSTHGLLDSKTFNIGLLKPKDIHGNVVDAGPRVTSKRGVPSPRDGGSDSSGYSTSSDAASRKRAPRGGLQRRLKAIKLEPRYSPDDNEDNENRETDEENDGSDNGDEDEDNSSNNSDGDVDDEE